MMLAYRLHAMHQKGAYEYVGLLFSELMHREADAALLRQFTDLLSAGMSKPYMLAQFLRSPELALLYSAPLPSSLSGRPTAAMKIGELLRSDNHLRFVQDMYTELLCRPPSSAECSSLMAMLREGMSRLAIVAESAASEEFHILMQMEYGEFVKKIIYHQLRSI